MDNLPAVLLPSSGQQAKFGQADPRKAIYVGLATGGQTIWVKPPAGQKPQVCQINFAVPVQVSYGTIGCHKTAERQRYYYDKHPNSYQSEHLQPPFPVILPDLLEKCNYPGMLFFIEDYRVCGRRPCMDSPVLIPLQRTLENM
jgi:hypothetical protein